MFVCWCVGVHVGSRRGAPQLLQYKESDIIAAQVPSDCGTAIQGIPLLRVPL